MTGSAFDALESLMLGTNVALYARPCTVYPMKSTGPNSVVVADPNRPTLRVMAIRSEWSATVDNGDNGMGRASGAFRTGTNAQVSRATFQVTDMLWPPGRQDEMVWDDRPGLRYRISEPLPDGGTGLTVTLNRITQ
jgi:hypothetical protein